MITIEKHKKPRQKHNRITGANGKILSSTEGFKRTRSNLGNIVALGKQLEAVISGKKPVHDNVSGLKWWYNAKTGKWKSEAPI